MRNIFLNGICVRNMKKPSKDIYDQLLITKIKTCFGKKMSNYICVLTVKAVVNGSRQSEP